MVKVKEDEPAMADPKTLANCNGGSGTHAHSVSVRKLRNHHYPSHHHHYSYHYCTFPQPVDTSDANGTNASAPAHFKFGPGFEPQTVSAYGAGPSQMQNNSEYIVLFHVHPGVTISFQIGDNMEVLRGPVTVPMVSTNSSPPIAMPVQVPPGHVVQQIVDESGTLRHVILSPQHPAAGLLPITSHNPPHYTGGPSNGTNQPPHNYPYSQGLPPAFPPHFHANIPPGPHQMPPQPPGQSPPPSYYKDERTQRQYFKLRKKLQDKHGKTGDGSSVRKDMANGIRRGKDKGMNSVGTSEDGEESSSVQDEEDTMHYVTELLSSVQAPEVSDLSSRSALLKWAAPLRLSEAASNDSHELDISENDLRYEVLLSDKSKEMKYKAIYNGKCLSCRIQDLRPGVEYTVRLQVHLDELQGSASDPLKFTTPACEPDQPQPPKLISRTKNSLQLRWNAPIMNGSPILHYALEFDEGQGGDFVELHKSKAHQYTLQKLQPATCYKFRLSAVNEIGRSVYSDVVTHYTSDNAPQQPAPPLLERSSINSLHVYWHKRPKDEDFILQMSDPHNIYGFLPIYNGRDIAYICSDLRRFTDYKFKLRAQNEGGYSPWSEEVTFQTLPDRPKRPSKPIVKGRIHAHLFKLKWEPPSDTGGAEISQYILEVNSGSGYNIAYKGMDTEAVCDNLTPGTTYQLRVSCESIGGQSNYSDPCTVTTDAISPGECPLPTIQGKVKATNLVLVLCEPDYNGGAPVLEYEVEMIAPDDSRSLVHKSKVHECPVGNLQPGLNYSFMVRAVNRIGPGPWSQVLKVTSGAAPPDTPQLPLLTCKSPFHILITWQEPPNNGASITEYKLEMSLTGNEEQFSQIYQGSSMHYDLKNAIPNTSYYFRLQACNSAGSSQYSPVLSKLTPPAAPSAIHNIKCESTPTTVTIHWNEPLSNGSAITHYNIELGDQVYIVESTFREYIYTIESLHPETVYKMKIQAVNSVGAGVYSHPIKITTLKLPPAPPKLECVATGHNNVKLKWGEGKNIEYTQYCIEMINSRWHEYQVVFRGTAFTCKVNKLQELTTYKFRINASNDAGEGDFSEEYEFTTSIAPPAPIKAPKVIEIEQRSCALEWLLSKNITNDPINYLVQCSRLKEQQYKQVYKGPDLKCTLENLEPGAEYTVRVCPIRMTQTGELIGPFSSSTSFVTKPVEVLGARSSSLQSSTPVHAHKSRNFMKSVWSQNKAMTEEQKVFLVATVIVLVGVFLAALIIICGLN